MNRDERVKQLKRRKREWLMKLYKSGLAERSAAYGDSSHEPEWTEASSSAAVAVADSSSSCNCNDAAQMPLKSYSKQRSVCPCGAAVSGCGGYGKALDMCDKCSSGVLWGDLEEHGCEEVEVALVEWSKHLDYESYLEHWVGAAVTLASEAWVPQSEQHLFMMVEE